MKRLWSIAWLLFVWAICAIPPKVTVVIVIDQFAAHYVPKLSQYWHYGLHTLLQKGTYFENAYQPHGIPATAVGHTGLATGVLPNVHGIIDNAWYLPDGTKVSAYTTPTSFALVPTINKKFLAENIHNSAIALSFKERAARGMAGQDIPAIWFNDPTEKFTTSKHSPLIDRILETINNAPLLKPHKLIWKLAYTDQSYYAFKHIKNYAYASEASLMPRSRKKQKTEFLSDLEKMPYINQLLLTIAREFIAQSLPTSDGGALLVWISLSSLDKLGHVFGPESLEAIDTLYHLDQMIGTFMTNVAHDVPTEKTLYILTADHGVMPIPELSTKNDTTITRILRSKLSKKVEHVIAHEYNIASIFKIFDPPFIILNHDELKLFSAQKQQEIVNRVIEILEKQPGITAVHRPQELVQKNFTSGSATEFLKNHVFKNRSGDLLIEFASHTYPSKYATGTGHNTPDPNNTHVPLAFYQPGTFAQQTITQRAYIPQVASTLQNILTHTQAQPQMLAPLPTAI